MKQSFPRFLPVQQRLAPRSTFDVRQTLRAQWAAAPFLSRLKPGASVAVGVGSRGIADLAVVVGEVIACLRDAGARPFVIPAMGSHGGATAEGQQALLAEYGITEEKLGVRIDARMDARRVGMIEGGREVLWSIAALEADAVFVINRVKPHTDFGGDLGSGLLKMLVVGLGKHAGAAAFHAAASRAGYEPVIRLMADLLLRQAPVLGGLAMVEGSHHELASVKLVAPEEMMLREPELLAEARHLMPRLPFEEIDLLVVDRIGKNISGAGLDPNVIGRSVHGYSTSLADRTRMSPRIHRIFVRDLTPETHGNAIGIGAADFTTGRLVRSMDRGVTFTNALTALTLNGAKIPIHFESDRECLERAFASLALVQWDEARVVRIADTLNLTRMEISEVWLREWGNYPQLEQLGDAAPWTFDEKGDLRSLPLLPL